MRALGTLPRSHLPARLFWPATFGVAAFFCVGLFAAYGVFVFMPKPPGGRDITFLAGIGLIPGCFALAISRLAWIAWRRDKIGLAAVLAALPLALFLLLALRIVL